MPNHVGLMCICIKWLNQKILWEWLTQVHSFALEKESGWSHQLQTLIFLMSKSSFDRLLCPSVINANRQLSNSHPLSMQAGKAHLLMGWDMNSLQRKLQPVRNCLPQLMPPQGIWREWTIKVSFGCMQQTSFCRFQWWMKVDDLFLCSWQELPPLQQCWLLQNVPANN